MSVLDGAGTDPPDRTFDPADSTYRLVRRLQGGDETALDRLCERYLPRMRRWARGRLPRRARSLVDTDDLVQDVLIQTIRRLGAFEYGQPHALQAYVRHALHNQVLQEVRRATRRPEALELKDEDPVDDRSPLEDLVAADVLRRYEAALERLEAADREAIVARIELGCDYPEIADALDKPTLGAARKAVSRALVRLAREMGRDG